MSLTSALVNELEREAATTRRVLERVPEDRMSWAPHRKSMTMGQLALHIAGLPLGISRLLTPLVSEVPTVPLYQATSRDQILKTLAESVDAARDKLLEWGDEGLQAEWRMTIGGETTMTVPRIEMVRTLMLNHWYHHRGQMLVYLRLNDVPVPPVYGPTADESPFVG